MERGLGVGRRVILRPLRMHRVRAQIGSPPLSQIKIEQYTRPLIEVSLHYQVDQAGISRGV